MAKAILLAIGSFVVGILEDMGVDVEDILDKLSDAWSRIWEGIHSVLDNIWQGKIRPVFDLLEAGMDAVGKAGWVLRNVLGSAMNSMRNAVLAPVDAIVQAFNNLKSRIDWIQGQIQALLRTFDNAKRVMGNWFPASVNSAAGTAFFAGGLTNINERGTELIALPGARQTMLPRGTTIYNAEQSRAIMAGAGGGITVNLGPITIANNMDVETMAWRVAKIIESSQR
jgi:phage-related protein